VHAAYHPQYASRRNSAYEALTVDQS
jgi:hypothetical protein